MHRCVHNLQSDKRGQFEILQADANLGGSLSNEADVRRGGEDFVDTERALVAIGAIKRHPGDRWKWVSVKLQEGG
jgi:hypothetical protein